MCSVFLGEIYVQIGIIILFKSHAVYVTTIDTYEMSTKYNKQWKLLSEFMHIMLY